MFLLNSKGKTVDTFKTINPLVLPRSAKTHIVICPQCKKEHKAKQGQKLAVCSNCGWNKYTEKEIKVNLTGEQQEKILGAHFYGGDIGGKVEVLQEGVTVKPLTVEKPTPCPSILHWCTELKYLGGKNIWPENLKTLLAAFQEQCSFCGAALRYGRCVLCDKTQQELFPRPVNEVVGIRGQRTGSSFLCAVAATYQLQNVLSFNMSLSTYYAMPPTEFEMVFVDPGKHIWNHFWELIHNSSWFEQYWSFLKNAVNWGFSRPSNDKAIFTANGKTNLIVRRGGVEENYRGGTRIFAAIDDPDWVDCYSRKNKLIPIIDIYTGLKNSLSTVKKKANDQNYKLRPLLWLMGPPNGNDKKESLLRKLKEAKKQPHSRLILHQPTWEINPETSKEKLQEEARNEAEFRRDFGAEFVKVE